MMTSKCARDALKKCIPLSQIFCLNPTVKRGYRDRWTVQSVLALFEIGPAAVRARIRKCSCTQQLYIKWLVPRYELVKDVWLVLL